MSGKDALKTWLSDKLQRLLGVKRVETQLVQICQHLQLTASAAGECQRAASEGLISVAKAIQADLAKIEQLAEAAYCQQRLLEPISTEAAVTGQSVAPARMATVGHATFANLEELKRLESQGLFILGCARSGTTILARSLNRSPDVLLLEEPNFFLLEQVTEFVSFFNRLHASLGNRCMKGTYLPPPRSCDGGPIASLLRLAGDYRYVGEKVAVGPHDYPANWSRRFLDFHGKYFLRAKYLHIVRTPAESIWSMHKMFPERPISRLFETWLRTIALSLDAYHVFPNSKVLFFEDVDQSLIERLGKWLGLPVPSLPGTFGRKYIYSALSPGEVPEPLLPFADRCRECTAIYRELRVSFSRDEFVYCGSTTEWAHFDALLRRIDKMIDDLAVVESSGARPLRIAA
jgi:hypothetical protein